MNFHDTRGMYDDIAQWLEENDVEVDWEAIMQCKWWVGPKDWVPPPKWSQPLPWPKQLTATLVTKLLLAQENRGLQIPQWIVDPNEQRESLMLVDRGGEGVELRIAGELTTGLPYWEKFLLQLEGIQLTKVTISLVCAEERKQLVRMCWIEEELRRRELEDNRERVGRQARGGAKFYLSRKGAGWLLEMARRGNLESIEELARRGIGSESEHQRWRETNAKLVKNMAKTRMKKVVKEASESSKGTADAEARGTVMGSGVRLEGAAGPLEVATQWAGDKGMVDEGVADNEVDLESRKVGIERELEVIRVGPNPRILTCRYRELASERVCKVGVKTVSNFVRGMKFRMVEPVNELEYGGVWRYEGKLPRARGRW